MRIFMTKLKELVRANNDGRSCAPRDVLFDAQLPFLKERFGDFLRGVDHPKDGGPYVFRCSYPPKLSVYKFKEAICAGNWGSFKIVDIRIRCSGLGNVWPTADVLVDLA